MQIQGSVAIVTGANRGLGKAFVQALLDAGARKVYVAARHPSQITDFRLQPIQLDISNQQDIAQAAQHCQDLNVLINNAGIMRSSPLLEAPSMDAAQEEVQTNYLGTLAMCRAFAPILKQNGGGALVNMLSVVSWYNHPLNGSYGVSKSAEWSMTNGIRIELRAQGTLVVGVYAGFIDTDMTARIDQPKSCPEDVATRTLEAIAAGREEVLADNQSQETRTRLDTDPQSLYRDLQQLWDSGARLA